MRDNNSNVVLVGLQDTTWSDPVTTGIQSFSQPAITCSPSACLLVVARAMNQPTITAAAMQWLEFTWVQTGVTADFVEGPLTTTSWPVESDPTVSVVSRLAGGYDFLVVTSRGAMSGGVPGTRVIPYRHTQGTTGSAGMVWLFPEVAWIPGVYAQAVAAGLQISAETFTFASY